MCHREIRVLRGQSGIWGWMGPWIAGKRENRTAGGPANQGSRCANSSLPRRRPRDTNAHSQGVVCISQKEATTHPLRDSSQHRGPLRARLRCCEVSGQRQEAARPGLGGAARGHGVPSGLLKMCWNQCVHNSFVRILKTAQLDTLSGRVLWNASYIPITT